MNAPLTRVECVEIVPTQDEIAQAKALRELRDTKYGNYFPVTDEDCRWVGDLGEIIMHRYLNEQGIEHTWLAGMHAAGEPDFLISGVTIDIKTVKRKLRILPHQIDYGCQVTAKQTEKKVNLYCFASYSTEDNVVQLIGARRQDRFKREAKFCPAGTQVHRFYTVRAGHEIYNSRVDTLTPMDAWLNLILSPLAA